MSANIPVFSSPQSNKNINYFSVVIAILMVIAVIIRLPGFRNCLWYDEVWYTFIYLNDSHIKKILFEDIHPLLYPLFMGGWIRLFGDSEIAVRLPSLAFGLVSMGLSGVLARRWFGRKTALIYVALLAVSPVHIWLSHEAKNNMLLLMLTQATVLTAWLAWEKDRIPTWGLAALCAVCALWTNIFAVWIVGAVACWMGYKIIRVRSWRTDRGKMIRVVVWGLIVGLAWLPFVFQALTRMGAMQKLYLRPFNLPELYKLYLMYLGHGYTIHSISPWAPLSWIFRQSYVYLIIDLFFLILLLTGLWSVIHSRRWGGRPYSDGDSYKNNDRSLLFFCFFLSPIALMAASWVVPHIYVERSMIIVLPFYLMILVAGIISFKNKWINWALIFFLMCLNLWGVTAMRGAKSGEWTVWFPKPDWRSATAYLIDTIKSDENNCLVLSATPVLAMHYYHARLTHVSFDQRKKGNVHKLPTFVMRRKLTVDSEVNRETGSAIEFREIIANNVFLIRNVHWRGQFRQLKALMDHESGAHLEEIKQFKGLAVYHYKRQGKGILHLPEKLEQIE